MRYNVEYKRIVWEFKFYTNIMYVIDTDLELWYIRV
jgi:hypothetical protein